MIPAGITQSSDQLIINSFGNLIVDRSVSKTDISTGMIVLRAEAVTDLAQNHGQLHRNHGHLHRNRPTKNVLNN